MIKIEQKIVKKVEEFEKAIAALGGEMILVISYTRDEGTDEESWTNMVSYNVGDGFKMYTMLHTLLKEVARESGDTYYEVLGKLEIFRKAYTSAMRKAKTKPRRKESRK